jgi:major capsid protein E
MSTVFAAEHTRMLQEVIREIETDPTEYKGAEYMPAIEIPSATVFVDVLEARGGLINEHTLGTDPQAAPRRQFRTQQYAPGAYKEFIRFNEGDILRLRELGLNDLSKRGIRQHLNENALVLNNRIEARMELLRWQAIFNGTYIYDGKTVNFGVPAGNNVLPVTPWGANDGMGNFTTANAGATPVQDMRYWTMGGYAQFRKYKITKIIMNPNTERMVLDNPAVQSLIQNRFAAETYKMHNINEVMGFLVPGMPPIEVYRGWYQNETVNATTGQITQSNAVYFIPDGSIFFEVKLPDSNKIGDVVMSLSLANGSVDAPAPGKFILVDEHIEDRPGNPYIDVIGGFYGGPRLKRAFDTLTATVI